MKLWVGMQVKLLRHGVIEVRIMRSMRETIESALRDEDIEGLLDAGAPADEYASEAERIAVAIASLSPGQRTQEHILAIFALAWMKNFELGEEEMVLRLPALRRIALRVTS